MYDCVCGCVYNTPLAMRNQRTHPPKNAYHISLAHRNRKEGNNNMPNMNANDKDTNNQQQQQVITEAAPTDDGDEKNKKKYRKYYVYFYEFSRNIKVVELKTPHPIVFCVLHSAFNQLLLLFASIYMCTVILSTLSFVAENHHRYEPTNIQFCRSVLVEHFIEQDVSHKQSS